MIVTAGMLAVIVVFGAGVYFYGDPPETRRHTRRRTSRLRRPPLPRRPGRLTPADRATLQWVRSLGHHPTWTAATLHVHITTLAAITSAAHHTWTQHAAAERIASLDVPPAIDDSERPWADDTGTFTKLVFGGD
jgi:hypothetical protein